MPKIMDADVDYYIKKLITNIEFRLRESRVLEENDYELDYLVDDLRSELSSTAIALRRLVQGD